MSPRSWLYVPGDQRDKLVKADQRGADAIIIDLEDGVAPSAKKAARAGAARRLDEAAAAGGAPAGAGAGAGSGAPAAGGAAATQWWVRCNPGPPGTEDLAAVVRPGLSGVLVPKVARRDELDLLDDELAAREAAAGLPPRSLAVVALVESAAGLAALPEIAAAPRVAHLSLGEVDLSADLGLALEGDADGPLELARGQVVIASAAAGLDSPVAGASIDFRDLERYRAGTERLRRRGFWGRKAIHPAQVRVINEVFAVAAEEAAAAADLVARYEAALAAGAGAVLDAHGRMLDEAVVRGARRTLRRASSCRAIPAGSAGAPGGCRP